MSDEIYVINKKGYIGESTKCEIEYAIETEKIVKYLEDLLLYLNDNEENVVIDEEINNTKIKGLKFYFLDDKQGTMNQLEKMVISIKD